MQNTNSEQDKFYCEAGWFKRDNAMSQDDRWFIVSNKLEKDYNISITPANIIYIYEEYIATSKMQQKALQFNKLGNMTKLVARIEAMCKITKNTLEIINRLFVEVELLDSFFRVAKYYKWNKRDLKNENDMVDPQPQPQLNLSSTTPQPSKKITLNRQLINRKAHLKRRGILDFMKDTIYNNLLLSKNSTEAQPPLNHLNHPHRVIETLELKKEEQPIIKKLSLAYKDSYIPYVKEENPRSAEFRENEPKSISSIFKTSSLGKQYNHTNESENCQNNDTSALNRGVFCTVA